MMRGAYIRFLVVGWFKDEYKQFFKDKCIVCLCFLEYINEKIVKHI